MIIRRFQAPGRRQRSDKFFYESGGKFSLFSTFVPRDDRSTLSSSLNEERNTAIERLGSRKETAMKSAFSYGVSGDYNFLSFLSTLYAASAAQNR